MPLLSILRDISDRKRLQAENARLHRELDELARTRALAGQHTSMLLPILIAELRPQLNVVMGFADVLKRGMGGPVNEKQAAYLDDIREAAVRQLHLMSAALQRTARTGVELGPDPQLQYGPRGHRNREAGEARSRDR